MRAALAASTIVAWAAVADTARSVVATVSVHAELALLAALVALAAVEWVIRERSPGHTGRITLATAERALGFAGVRRALTPSTTRLARPAALSAVRRVNVGIDAFAGAFDEARTTDAGASQADAVVVTCATAATAVTRIIVQVDAGPAAGSETCLAYALPT